MADIGNMRSVLRNYTKYSDSEAWRNRVDNMPEMQVFAVYKKMSQRHELLTEPKRNPTEVQISFDIPPQESECQQLCMFDW